MTRRRALSIAWAIASIFFISFLLLRIFNGGLSIQTNMLALLPTAQRDAATLTAIEHQQGEFTNRVAFLIGADSKSQSQRLASGLVEHMQASSAYQSVSGQVDMEMGIRLYQFYQPYQAGLLTADDLNTIQIRQYQHLNQRVLESIAMPGFGSGLLEQDPLLTFTRFISASQFFPGSFKLDNGWLTNYFEQRFYTLVHAEISANPFSMDMQARFSENYQAIQQWLKTTDSAAVLLSAGMIHNAMAGVETAKSEISTIGLGSLLGILFLFLISFASLRPILLALIPILIGISAAISVCALVFESIHIMTLVFGSSLIGVSIDYTLHFFAEQSYADEQDDSQTCLARIMPGITLGLITSLVGYLAFFIAPFPGLQQMALFSSVGLTAAYCCVVFWFPFLPIAVRRHYRSVSRMMAERLIAFWSWHRRLAFPFVPVLFLLLAVVGLLMVDTDDDIRSLDNTPESLKADRAQFEAISGIKPTSQFILVSGESPDSILQREAQLTQRLEQAIQEGNLYGYRAISNSVPSAQQQYENYQAVRDALSDDEGLLTAFDAIGYDASVGEQYQARYQKPKPDILSFDAWQQSEFFDSSQWLAVDQGLMLSIVNLYGLQDVEQLKQTIEGLQHVQLVDQVADITEIFRQYRHIANRLVLLAYIVILLFLIYRYRWWFALKIMFPPVLAGLFAIAMSGILGLPLTLFNTLALLLVLGIGIDYTLFFAESKGERASTMLGILLSSMTTILSFGLLALSATPALQSIGLTVLSGIALAFFLAPMVASEK